MTITAPITARIKDVPGEIATASDHAAPISPDEADVDDNVDERVTEAFISAFGGTVRVKSAAWTRKRCVGCNRGGFVCVQDSQ